MLSLYVVTLDDVKRPWEKLADAVGAIDGTSHEIYRPMNEPQQQFYSGNRSYHCLHTQMVVDATGIMRYIESGFMGHLNDAQKIGLMRRIGTELCFPEQCVLLGDKIYPNGNCTMTPYTAAQLARYYRIGVEHAFAELKQYKTREQRAHLISWASKAHNIQNLKNIW